MRVNCSKQSDWPIGHQPVRLNSREVSSNALPLHERWLPIRRLFRSNGFVSAAEILIAAGRRGYTVTEVPLILRARTAGQSKMKIMRTIASHLAMLWSLIAPTATPARLAPRTSNALDDRN